jgi:diguanylate cyclase (GGDEF)-like protein
MKILLADDDAISRALLKRTLERAGFEVVCFADGQAALDCLLQEDGPRMAILDWEMPKKNGPAICREIRARIDARTLYLIMLTSREAIEDIVSAFDAGADDYLTKPCNPQELKARIQVGMRSLELHDSLIHTADHDSLTGLPNRAHFVKRLASNVRKARQTPDYHFTLLFVDVDRFKLINDSLGHLVGDELMKGMAKRLVHAVRAEATLASPARHGDNRNSYMDLVARIGGDEFVILLEECADIHDGVRVAERIQEELQTPFILSDSEVLVSVSIGISTSEGGTTEASEVLRGADAAMYKAKILGKARYEIDDSSGNADAINLLKLESDLRHAVENEEFEVYYQPIVDLSDGRILSFEALVRWQHPTRGLLYPDVFIPIAEETGLIVPMGVMVMRDACRQTHEWNTRFAFERPLSVSVNVSPKQFAQDTLVGQIRDVLSETGLDAMCLEVEVTENLTMKDAERAVRVLSELSKLGISISLDDFGTGYSSLSYLLRLPIQTLKIDRSFISSIEHTKESLAIVQTIIALSHNLGKTVIAEGIETTEQMEMLRAFHCDLGQGYLFSRPIEAARATEMLEDYAASLAAAEPQEFCIAA